MKKLLSALGIVALPALGVAGLRAQGPPQFLTRPILLHVGEDGLDHGHFVFAGEDAAVPAPLVRDFGAASFAAATGGGTSLLTGLDGAAVNPNVNVSNSPDSYEGETGATGAVAANGVLVAGGDTTYLGNC